MKRTALAFAFTITSLMSAANAAPTTFFGEDINTNGDPNPVSSFTNSNGARTSFFSNLTGVGTETFDTTAVGTGAPIPVTFPGAGTATINGGSSVATGNDGAGRYAVSAPNYLFADRNNFSITFSTAISAFGFYGVDIGDFGGQLSLTLTDSLNNITTLMVPHTLGSGGSTSGSVLYFGFYDTTTTYTSINFGNNSSGNDAFAFDSFSVGALNQITPTPAVPEPSTWAMMILGFAGIGTMAYRRRKTATLAV